MCLALRTRVGEELGTHRTYQAEQLYHALRLTLTQRSRTSTKAHLFKPPEVLWLSEQDVGLETVLVVGVDPSSHPTLFSSPFSIVDVDGRTHQVVTLVSLLPNKLHRSMRFDLKFGVACETAEGGKL